MSVLNGSVPVHSDGNVCSLRSTEETVPQAYFSIFGFGLLGAAGVLGNIIVIVVFWEARDRILRMQILTLSFTDLFICSVILPLDCVRVFRRILLHMEAFTDHAFADTVISARNTGFVFEGCILQCIALDRYYCVCRAHQSKRLTPAFFFGLLSLAALSVGGLEVTIAVLHLFFDPDCRYVQPMRETLRLTYPCFSILGMLVIFCLYVAIFIRVHQQDRANRRRKEPRVALSSCSSNGREKKEEDEEEEEALEEEEVVTRTHKHSTIKARSPKTALMLLCTTVVYYFTLMPIILVGFDAIPDGPYHKIYYINNAANVLLYSLVNRQFRVAARSWLLRRRRKPHLSGTTHRFRSTLNSTQIP